MTCPPGGGWWHLHFVRCRANYPCGLLGRPTDVVACLQWFGAGAVARSPQFVLTLDGEGVEGPAGVPPLDFDWGQAADASEAAHFQQSVVRLLRGSPAFQSAAAEVARSERHLRVVRSGWPADAGPGATADTEGRAALS